MSFEKQNYQKMLDSILQTEEMRGRDPSLLLHACCAPCSSYVLEYLAQRFRITLFFYNPNISPEAEYRFREAELHRLVEDMHLDGRVSFLNSTYDPETFQSAVRGMETLVEGGARCHICYRLRLHETAKVAAAGGFDYFGTTLSISPYKNAEWLNTIGKEESEAVGVSYLFSDFKKKNGYKRSCELSAEYGLYRQNYCGCIYSKRNQE